MAIEAVSGDVIPAPVAPATPLPASLQPSAAGADLQMTPAEVAREKIQALKADPEF